MRTVIPSAAFLGVILFANITSAATQRRFVADERGNLYSAQLVTAGVQVVRRSHDGAIGFDTTVDGLGEVRLGAVAADRSGGVWVTGSTRSSESWDIFVLQLNSQGAVVRNERIDGDGDDFGEGIAVSPDGATVYLAGSGPRPFVWAIDAKAARLLWTRTMDGPAMLATGYDGQLYLAGPVGSDAVVMQLDPTDGHTLWRTLAAQSLAPAVVALLALKGELLLFVRTQDAEHGNAEFSISLTSDGRLSGKRSGTVEQYWSSGVTSTPSKERNAATRDRAASPTTFDPAAFTSLGTLTAAGTVTFDTDALTYTGGGSPGVLSNGVAVFSFAGISIPSGASVKGTGSRPFALLSQGNITIDGVLDGSGANAVDLSEAAVAGGPGGYCGGQWASNLQQPGCGPGGGGASPGAGAASTTGGGGGGFGGAGGVGGNVGGAGGTTYGNLTTILDGGSGGASGTRAALNPIATTGGGGGGALLVVANGTITINAGGVVRATGGNGAIGAKASSGAGAGGGIYLKATTIVNNGTVSANGGVGADGGCCGGGGGGGGGRIVSEGTLSGSGTFTVNGGAGGTSGGSPGTSATAGSDGVLVYIAPTYTFSSAGTTVPSTAGTGTVSLTVAPSTATWNASSNQSWLTLTSGQSGTGSGTIGYSYTQNPSMNSRSAIITARGSTFTITQQGAAVNVSFDSASQTVSSNSGTGSAALTVTPSDGGWSVASNQGWLTLTSSATGTGSTIVQFSFSPNASFNSRQAVITATAGSSPSQSTHTVTQSGVPVTAVFSPLSASKSAAAGSDSFEVTISPHCAPWGTVTSDQSWLVVGAYDGNADGSVSYSYTANNSVNARVGHITVGTSQFTVTQAGVPPIVTLVPPQISLGAAAGNANFLVNIAPPDGAYTVTTATPWITITSPGSRAAGGTVTFSYLANGSVFPRQGTIDVISPGALVTSTFTITQAALPTAFIVDPQVTTVNADATPLTLDVAASPAEVTWTAASNVPWITVPDATTRVGNGKVSVQIAANATGVMRSGTLTVAGLTVTINQRTPDTCAVELVRDGWSAAFVGDVADIGITAASGCPWTVSGNPAWVTFAGSAAGSGNGGVKLRIAPNPQLAARTASLLVGGKSFIIHQLANGCELSLTTRQGSLAPSGDTLAIQVVTGSNCEWRPFIGPSWLSTSYSSAHQGTETLTLSAGPNLTNATRTAGLIAGSQVVQVVQGSDNTSQQFLDVPRTHPFFPYIAGLGRYQANAGCGGGNFCPDANASRAELAAFIVRAVVGESFSFESQPYFTDVPAGHPQFRYIQKIRELGITSGCTASTYCPDDPITRGQMAALLLRARFGLQPTETIPVAAIAYFTDVLPGSLFFPPVQKMKDLSVTTGCWADAYCPDAPTTRGQTAAFLLRVFYTP